MSCEARIHKTQSGRLFLTPTTFRVQHRYALHSLKCQDMSIGLHLSTSLFSNLKNTMGQKRKITSRTRNVTEQLKKAPKAS